MVRPNLQRFVGQERFQILEQQFVLENTAGENNDIEALRLGDGCNGITQALSQSALKAPRNLGKSTPLHTVMNYRLQQRAEIEFLADEGKRIWLCAPCTPRELLKPHR